MKFNCHQISNGLFIKVMTEDEKTAYENDPHLRRKYRFEEIKEAPVPKGAKKVKEQKPSSDDD